VRLGGVRIDWREESNFEGERGVLRLGMVSEGGEYGSNPLSSFKSGRNEEKSTGK
jgi:hypothetical protein